MSFYEIYWNLYVRIQRSLLIRLFFRGILEQLGKLHDCYKEIQIANANTQKENYSIVKKQLDLVADQDILIVDLAAKNDQVAKLKELIYPIVREMRKIGDKQDWTEAAETSRVYTWAEFQELDQLLKELG